MACENGNGLLGSITGFTFPLSKKGFNFSKVERFEVTAKKKAGGGNVLFCFTIVTMLPPGFTAFAARSISPAD